mgnify:CR=1 FL=1
MIDTIAREPLWQHLINYRCGTGHSVSFVGNVHEGPHALNGRNTTLMRPGMIVTDEPGVYETDLVGIRIENELVCVHKADNQYGTFLALSRSCSCPSPPLPSCRCADQGRAGLAEQLPPSGVREAGTPPERRGARVAGQEVRRHRLLSTRPLNIA